MLLSGSCNTRHVRLFTGSFTKPGEKGLNIFDLNREEGILDPVSESDAGPSPAYLCFSGKHGYIYAANEVMDFKGITGGGVTTLSYDPVKGVIKKINEIGVPDGSPCFISLSADEDYLFLANYTGGSVVVIKLDEKGIPLNVTDNIKFGEVEGQASHPHMISPGPSGKRVYLTDLGLDRIVIYNLDKVTGRLEQMPNGIVKLSEGSGPRHFVFSSDGAKMYVICELNSTISVFNVNPNGELSEIQTLSALDKDFRGKSACADIHIGKSGEYLYGSNRGENTIVIFRIVSDGTLVSAGRTTCGGDWPRNFVIDPAGKYLLVGNERSGNITLFRIDKNTGIPVEPGKNFDLPAPACLKFFD